MKRIEVISNGPGIVPGYTTIFDNKEEPSKLAEIYLSDEEDGWTYKVEEYKGGFVVMVYDDENVQMGTL